MIDIKTPLKTITAILLCVSFLVPFSFSVYSQTDGELPFDLDCRSAVLMEADTGEVLYNKNGSSPYPPASVTKIMTLLLVLEDVDAGKIGLGDTVTVSENAASKGGSQIFLEPNEKMSVDELLKAVAVASANDAATALAEHVCGSEDAFVKRMNERASELGMRNSNFENPTGLDDTVNNHVASALDIAVMSRELLKHQKILDYTTIWMDSVRDGQFGLTNTNRLIRFYPGANGLKTGSTSKAKFCISATAKRDGMQLIAVIMGSPTRDIRNECAKKLLDYGFANYAVARFESKDTGEISVKKGVDDVVGTYIDGNFLLIGKGNEKDVGLSLEFNSDIYAPVHEGDKVGEAVYTLNGVVLDKKPIRTKNSVEKIGFFGLLCKILKKLALKK